MPEPLYNPKTVNPAPDRSSAFIRVPPNWIPIVAAVHDSNGVLTAGDQRFHNLRTVDQLSLFELVRFSSEKGSLWLAPA
jgi:hypothetical protein